MAASRNDSDDGAPAIVWFRQDLRLADNPALAAAAAIKRPLICLYVLDDETPGRWRLGGASRWWLHESLQALTESLARRGLSLTLRRGKAELIVSKLAKELGAGAVFWNRCYEPYAVARDTALKQTLMREGVEVGSSKGSLLFEPWTIKNKSGEPYKVFSPFWRACLQMDWRRPEPAPKILNAYSGARSGEQLASWRLLPAKPNWACGFDPLWKPGEAGARQALELFIEERLETYVDRRDELALDATSRLSPHLHFGEISPAQVRSAIEGAAASHPKHGRSADKYLTEIGWREFSANLLFHWPTLPDKNWRTAFDAFQWREDRAGLEAWRRGQTGYPVVDAAMRELWTTGYMHNRARMVAASFLIKHLMVDWREGEAWFWDTLVDADLANNAASWQWVAGSGADASPYFRIFNPVTQGERYDPDGAYIRRWVPELAALPNAFIHKPWTADAKTLRTAGIVLGETYPAPIVEHSAARTRALEAFAELARE